MQMGNVAGLEKGWSQNIPSVTSNTCWIVEMSQWRLHYRDTNSVWYGKLTQTPHQTILKIWGFIRNKIKFWLKSLVLAWLKILGRAFQPYTDRNSF